VAEATATDLTDPAGYRHWVDDHVRFADLDPLGHCNHAVISGFFESSRVALFRDAGLALLQGGTSLSVVRLVLEFKRELVLGDRVRAGGRVVRLGRTSVTLANALFVGERCAATAEVVGVLIDLGKRSPTELPPGLRAGLSRFA
jgi:acyl-CoA thioester hydrolase